MQKNFITNRAVFVLLILVLAVLFSAGSSLAAGPVTLVPTDGETLKAPLTTDEDIAEQVGGEPYTPDVFSGKGDRVSAEITRKHLLGKTETSVKGKVRPSRKGQIVVIEIRKGKKWKSVTRLRTGKNGGFSGQVKIDDLGSTDIRVVLPSLGQTSSVKKPLGTVYRYRQEVASWYGPGFYGRKMSCGKTLNRSTIAVAHKTLPCGTKVRFHNNGKTVVASVEDRGPFIAGRDWDLTEATKNKLGTFNSVWVSYRR